MLGSQTGHDWSPFIFLWKHLPSKLHTEMYKMPPTHFKVDNATLICWLHIASDSWLQPILRLRKLRWTYDLIMVMLLNELLVYQSIYGRIPPQSRPIKQEKNRLDTRCVPGVEITHPGWCKSPFWVWRSLKKSGLTEPSPGVIPSEETNTRGRTQTSF